MGIRTAQWRARIGLFSQPIKSKVHLQTLTITSKYLSLGIRFMLFLLLVTEGVESNPGPQRTRSNVSNRGRGRGGVRSASAGSRPSNIYNTHTRDTI